MTMSFSDDYEFEELDSATLQELDIIEATAVEKSSSAIPTNSASPDRSSTATTARLKKIEQEIAKSKLYTSHHSSIPGASPTHRAQPGAMPHGFRPAVSRSVTLTPALDEPIYVIDEDGVPTEPESDAPFPQRPKLAYATSSNTGGDKPSRGADSFMTDTDESFMLDEADLQQIDRATAAALSGRPIVATNKLTRQTTLTGETLTLPSRPSLTRTTSSSGPQKPTTLKTKVWSHQAALSRTVTGRALSNPKGKGRAVDLEEETELPPLPVPDGPPPPMVLKCDPVAAKEWIFPLNHPKRDYQYNIVRRALFDNTLVALPTGLGKTFVAGVVMLNYYRWFPGGKIVFLAPTKPLVAQQIEASHQTCGIPGDDAAELTGHVKDDRRAILWGAKRVFYLTPQTFVNDLRKIPNLASQVVLIVVDEAHRATGGYAYSVAIRDMMALNPHFRVLALTATPGSSRDAVQVVVDSMHISHIEIRDEQALDLRQYVHRKKLTQHVVVLPQDFAEIADTIVKLMERLYSPVGHLIPGAVMRTMNEYRALKAISDLQQRDRWAIGILSNLASLARALSYLNTQSLEMGYEALLDLETGTKSDNGKRKYPQKKLAEEPLFRTIMRLFKQRQQASDGGSMVHPKMGRLRSLLLQYFVDQPPLAIDSNSANKGAAESKVMVFASYRRAVEQIVGQLNLDTPIIRAHRFIGQAATKDGVKGLSQKEQLKVIEDFKNGTFNTLVCTSIGEEGLDIGEVDYIVCYDSHKAPIKMLQRIGRTGRKKDGDIAVLVAEGKEETNFEKAKEAYNMVQNSITKGDHIELYTDVPRLLSSNVHPQPREMVMPIVGYRREASTAKASKSAGSIDKYVTKTRLSKEPKLTAKERKKMLAEAAALANADSDESESLDLDVTKTKGKGKGKISIVEEKSPSKPRNSRGEAREAMASPSDEELPAKTRKKKRKKVDSSSSSDKEPLPPKTSKKPVKKKKDIDGDPRPSRRKSKKEQALGRQGETSRRKKKKNVSSAESHHQPPLDAPPRPKFLASPTLGFVSGTGRKLVAATTLSLAAPIDISSDDEDLSGQKASRDLDPEPLSSPSSGDEMNIYKGVGAQTQPGSLPPVIQEEDATQNQPSILDLSPTRDSLHHSTSQMPRRFAGAHDWLLDSDSDEARVTSSPLKQPLPNGQAPLGRCASLNSHSAASLAVKRFQPHGADERGSSTDNLITDIEPPNAPATRLLPVFDLGDTSIELLPSSSQKRRNDVGFSRQPRGPKVAPFDSPFVTHTKLSSSLRAQSSSPIRSPGRIRRSRRPIAAALAHTLSSEVEEGDYYSGHAPDDNSSAAREHAADNKGRRRRPVYDRNNEFVAMEADLSGEDVVGGSTDTEGEEDEYDREFIADGDVTQGTDYDQTAMYLQGLQTQAPAGFNFANRPARVGVFGQAFSKSSRRPAYLSSSPPRKLDSEDVYEFGSFVVEDEDMEENE